MLRRFSFNYFEETILPILQKLLLAETGRSDSGFGTFKQLLWAKKDFQREDFAHLNNYFGTKMDGQARREGDTSIRALGAHLGITDC